MKRIAGIVLYNPEVERLKENVSAILPQVDELLLVENGSHDTSFLNQFEDVEKVVIIRNNGSKGIAYALNQILGYADSNGYEWALTLDQDSVCPDNLIQEYNQFVNMPSIGMICPIVNDRSIGIMDYSQKEYDYVDACITSASMISVLAWKTVGGFWEELFIDMVDFDICWSLQKQGFKVLRANRVSISHQVGEGKRVSFRGNDVGVFNHTPVRDYYIIRNTIAVGKKHRRVIQSLRWNLKRMYLVNKYESQRTLKNMYMLKGFWHGIIGKMGEYR